MSIGDRINKLRQKMLENSMTAYLIPSSDPHQNEYLPENYKTRQFISGFTGSAGTVVITKDKAGLWTDGRYFLQAEIQLKDSGIELYKMGVKGVPTINEFLQSELKPSEKVGLNGKIISVQIYESLKNELKNIEIMSDKDLIGEIWNDRPAGKKSQAFVHSERYAGKTAKEKIETVRKLLLEIKSDATVIGAPEDVCYLYNIRGRDIKCNPTLMSYAIVTQEKAMLFISKKQINDEVKQYLTSQGVTIMDYEDAFAEAEKLKGTVYIDPTRTNIYLYNKLKASTKKGLNLTSSMKCIKNDIELKNVDKAMEKDGVAMIKILKWVEENVNKGITECEVSDQLLKFRAEQDDFIEESFDTISGYGPNGAIIHYKPEPETCLTLEPKSFLLLDSGGHYLDGTTDITRTIPLGNLTDEEKENYTLVLKSHINLAMAKFVSGTTGYNLDTIARRPIWAKGKNYAHGTGHGVGFVLGVHEGPQSISTKQIFTPIQVGMITSNEPGLYISGKHGIRIESLVATTNFLENEFGEFYQFRTITLCPIDTRPIVKELLSQEEIDWLNDYHTEVQQRLSPYLDKEHLKFLNKMTQKFNK